MKANTKKGIALIIFGIIGISIISFIIGYIFRIIGLYSIGYYLGFLFSFIQLVFIVLGILQLLGKFNIDRYYDLSKFFGANNNSANNNEIYSSDIQAEDNTSVINSKIETEIKRNINQLNLNNMEYKIEQVGAEFSNRAIKGLESRFNSYANQGYKFHSVFQVQKSGCLGFGSPSITYLAVYVKE